MDSRTPDDPHVRRLQNRIGNLESRIDYLEETLGLLAAYVQSVEEDTISEPDVPDEVAERVDQLVNQDRHPDDEKPIDDDDRLFD